MTKRGHRLAVLATHPIQYQAPWYRALASCGAVELDVFFGHRASAKEQGDAGFGVAFEWDTPLLDGYRSQFLRNVAANPSVHRFNGIDTPEIGRLIATNAYDAVIVSGWNFKAAWQAMLACWRTGTPVMVRGDSHLYTGRSAAKRAVKAVAYRGFVPRLDACLSVGKWSAEYFRHYGAPPERIFFVPHVLDEQRFAGELRRCELNRAKLRERWQLDPDATVYLYSGKFIAKKRPLDFIRAVASASQDGRPVQGLMVGDGPLRAECETAVRELRAPVRFAGFLNQSQVVDGYSAADALILASDGGETWGLVAQEAMFCGRPCIVSDQVGCGPDLVTPGVTGDMFRCGDVPGLAALLASYSGPGRLVRMGLSARERAARYSIRAAVDGVLEALAAVTGRACEIPVAQNVERA
jgi:glycosyltransferase involved in cell wall biosynthesis